MGGQPDWRLRYAYSRIVANKRLWQIWLPLTVVWEIGVVAMLYTTHLKTMGLEFLVVMAIISGILIIPAWLAIYLYGYRSDALWLQPKSSNYIS